MEYSDYVIDCLFGLDIFVTFRTAYFNDELGGFETNPWKVARRYFGDFFLIDLFSTVPFDNLSKVPATLPRHPLHPPHHVLLGPHAAATPTRARLLAAFSDLCTPPC